MVKYTTDLTYQINPPRYMRLFSLRWIQPEKLYLELRSIFAIDRRWPASVTQATFAIRLAAGSFVVAASDSTAVKQVQDMDGGAWKRSRECGVRW